MQTILVPLSGRDTDLSVLAAAAALAAPLRAHLSFIHVPLTGMDLGVSDPHIEFATGSALGVALRERAAKSQTLEAHARDRAATFCAEHRIVQTDAAAGGAVSASWAADPCADPGVLLRIARTHDLILLGRSNQNNPTSLALRDTLVRDCGRPILLLPPGTAGLALKSVAIWWKDHSAAARAVGAAMPVIALAERVSVLAAAEDAQEYAGTAAILAKQLARHGVAARAHEFAPGGEAVTDTLWRATAAEAAHLVVMGAYSRSRVREAIFGGCTQSVLDAARLPVLLLH